MRTCRLDGALALVLDPDGPPIAVPRDASDLVGEAIGAGADVVVVPRERLSPAFFDLRSGLAGEVVQRLVNHRLRLVVVGDVTAEAAASRAFADFVREANRGGHVAFVAAVEGLG